MNANVNLEAQQLKQPPVFKLAYLTTVCERFGFYVLTYLLVLYAKEIYHLADKDAFILFGTFTALAFLSPAIGGYIADNFFGIRRSIVWGLFVEGTGLLLLAIPCKWIFPLALALVVIGVGLFKTAPTDLLAHSYSGENDPRIDSGFTLYYMAINIGSLLSSFVAGFLQKYLGWQIAFLVGGLVLYIGVIFYFTLHVHGEESDSAPGKAPLPITMVIKIAAGIIFSSAFCYFLVKHDVLTEYFLGFMTLLLFAYFIYEIIRSPRDEKLKIIACIYLVIIGFACAVLYFQLFTSIELFTQRSVVRTFFGFEVPTIIYLSLNPVFVVILGPVLAWIYNTLAKHRRDLSVVTKLSLGLLATALCFFFPVIGAYFPNSAFQISSLWLVGLFFMFTIGDLMNSALGVAMVTRIAPRRMYGVMMGAWFLIGNSLAASFSGIFADYAEVPDGLKDPHAILNIYTHAFTKIGLIGVVVSIAIFLINPYIKRIANVE